MWWRFHRKELRNLSSGTFRITTAAAGGDGPGAAAEKPPAQCRDEGAPSNPPNNDPSDPLDGVVSGVPPVGVPLGEFGLLEVAPWLAVGVDCAPVPPPVGVPLGGPAAAPLAFEAPLLPGAPHTTLSCAAYELWNTCRIGSWPFFVRVRVTSTWKPGTPSLATHGSAVEYVVFGCTSA